MIFSPLPALPGKDFRLVQGFYDRPWYYKKYGLNGHGGYDFAPATPGQKGVVVYATHDGRITQKNFGNEGYGKHVEIVDTCWGRMTVLAHFERFYPLPKDGIIKQGDPVGVMGQTGDADGIHCHLDFCHVDKDGNILNYNNGYHGRLPIAQYIRLWYDQTLGPPGA